MNAEITELCQRYEAALCDEIQKQEYLTGALLEAYARGVIDGKNAEARKLQELAETGAQQHDFDMAQARRKTIDAELGLTNAFWYSQFHESQE